MITVAADGTQDCRPRSYAEPVTDVSIELVQPSDVGEILTLQRAAYISEAQLYNNVTLPPLTQTLDELASELAESHALKARIGARIVGAGRAIAKGSVLHIGRLTVAPDLQGRGIGTALLDALEKLATPDLEHFTLFTGHLSTANIRLYQRCGYREVRREELSPDVVLVHLEKPATSGALA